MTNHLDVLARRLEDDPTFLACLLRLYAKSEGRTEEQLRQALGCAQESWLSLQLCRAPTGEQGQFHKGIQEIATRFNVDPVVLADAIRRGQAITQLRQPAGSHGTLAAARDRDMAREDNPQPGGRS